jgi:AraC family transcriptional regulator, regulatory protein of adaptative response / DNA-3-methyladenine glycosylase II
MSYENSLPKDEACYSAMLARDARFDGRFFTCVSSTKIYCRPICAVRPPKLANCSFVQSAALAELAGYRPCLRCRPELAPRARNWSAQDASAVLAEQAARLLQTDSAQSMQALADRLGVSTRHLQRVFTAHFGVAPLAYVQTQRLLQAKLLLCDSDQSISEIAFASGFSSLRRFNAAFVGHYRLNPSALRKAYVSDSKTTPNPKPKACIYLSYRPPYDHAALLRFFEKRAIPGIDFVSPNAYTRSVHIGDAAGWLELKFEPEKHRVGLRCAPQLGHVLPQLIAISRELLDLDALPDAIEAVLGKDFPDSAGIRIPGTVSGFELAVRAVLGQQVTVAAARTFAERLVGRFGSALAAPLSTPHGEITRCFPSAQTLAAASAEEIGSLGIVRQRQAAILALAKAVHEDGLDLSSSAYPAQAIEALKALPGIGPWTASYIAMRALRWPNAYVEGDVALWKALGIEKSSRAPKQALARAEHWQPWRSYAVLRAWESL